MGGPARDPGVRQVRRASSERDRLDVEPKRVSRDLGQRGPRALAHVVGADLHYAAPRPTGVAPITARAWAWNMIAGC